MTDKIMSLTKTSRNVFNPCFYCGEASEYRAVYKSHDETMVCLKCAKNEGRWIRNRKGWKNIPFKQKTQENKPILHEEESQNHLISDFSSSKNLQNLEGSN